MARNAAKPSPSQHPPPTSLQSNVNVDSHLSTRITTDPNTSDAVSRKRFKSSTSAGQTQAAKSLYRPSQLNQPAPLKSDIIPPPYTIDRHVLGQGGGAPGLVEATTTTALPNRMQRQQQQAGGESSSSSDRRDWAPQQPGQGEASSDRGARVVPSPSGGKAPSTPESPLLTQHAPGVKASTVDNQNITSLTRDKASIRGQKRRVPDGEAEAEFDQKRLLNIVQDLDKLEKEQKDFGKQQLQAIREGSV
ncbi:hypothetical protein HDV57DRAFT_516193 [Trichoderma longibrachiatum]